MEVKKASREEWSQPSSSHVKGFSNVPCCNCDERCLLRRANTQLNLGRLLSAHSIRFVNVCSNCFSISSYMSEFHVVEESIF